VTTWDHIVATVTLDTIVAFDIIAALVIPLFVLLSASPLMWCKEHHCDFSVLQRVHLSSLVHQPPFVPDAALYITCEFPADCSATIRPALV
jgi:hypothetical protein